MAYRIPQQHRQNAVTPTKAQTPRNQLSRTPSGVLGQSTTASEEWVVFSPSTDSATIKTPTSTSELGSFRYDDEDEVMDEEDDEEEDDDEDYDEDIDLHGFRDPYHQGPVMLPQHDGMGTFPSTLSRQASADRIAPGAPTFSTRDSFTNARIHAWRMEQSRLLLDEIEKATKGRLGLRRADSEKKEADLASMGGLGLEDMNGDVFPEENVESQETFWERLRRRLVQDIMGLDDMVLQIIFGEALPTELDGASGASTPTTATDGTGLKKMDSSWEEKLFERLARELGVLAQHYTPHVAKAAFSTYVTGQSHDRTKSAPATVKAFSTGAQTPKPSNSPLSLTPSASHITLDPLASTRHFHPTIGEDETGNAAHAASWGIEDEPLASSLLTASSEARVDAEMVREYWEKELNVRMLFSYLKSKLATPQTAQTPTATTRRPSQSSSTETSKTAPAATGPSAYTTVPAQTRNRYSSSQSYRHQHPLITSRPQTVISKTKRSSPIASLTSVLGVGMGGLRSGSSCASQSTTRKSSGQKNDVKGSTSSSRNFWDVGSTVGSSRSSCVGGPVWADV